jgi:predicted NBD/HSP70 family sugar kinase
MSENERRILALIADKGPMSKGDLVNRGHMAWATVVKYVNRLEAAGVLMRAGTAPRELQLGKNSYVFDLASDAPKFIGIDIEYRTTRVAVVDLRREILWQAHMPTPAVDDQSALVRFIEDEVLSRVCDSDAAGVGCTSDDFGSVVGIGIGMPRWLLPRSTDVFASLAESVSIRLGLAVRVENNTRAYTLYKEPQLGENTFVVVSVRNGIGAGLVIDGALHSGEEGLAGEIGHITAKENGDLCRCGKRGCLETVVNQHTLFESFISRIHRSQVDDAIAVEEGLPELFDWAAGGDEDAREILAKAAVPVGRALAILILVLDIRNIYIVGHFGEHGDAWLESLREVVACNVDPRINFKLHYRKLEEAGYLLGAAMLVGREYLDYSVLGGTGNRMSAGENPSPGEVRF